MDMVREDIDFYDFAAKIIEHIADDLFGSRPDFAV
jgi:hypothetical protein